MAIKKEESSVFLSKLYVKKEFRGNGYARNAFNFLIEDAKRLGFRSVWLTVNRENFKTIDIYKKMGFQILREEDNPIGSGYVMNDYIMEYPID